MWKKLLMWSLMFAVAAIAVSSNVLALCSRCVVFGECLTCRDDFTTGAMYCSFTGTPPCVDTCTEVGTCGAAYPFGLELEEPAPADPLVTARS